MVELILDSGSQSGYTTENLCKKRKKQSYIDISILEINNSQSRIKHFCKIEVRLFHKDLNRKIITFVLREITGNLSNINKSKINGSANLILTDLECHKPGPRDS